jgi:hypothetical protein
MLAKAQRILRHWPRPKWLLGVLVVAGMLDVGLATLSQAQNCRGIAVGQCRSTASEGGALLLNKVWTTRCGPNTFPEQLDTICDEVSRCPGAGSFGKFLRAVTGECKSKHFHGYFGLDGLTFGILDWTEDNLPALLQAYQQRSPDSFAQTLGGVGLPIQGGCLEARWACENNRQGRLMCDARFHNAFEAALRTAEFQQAQVMQALMTYEQRLQRFASLGLQTEYGKVAMAVIANNLKLSKPECQPSRWKAACTGQPDERSMVDCMLNHYANNSCRGRRSGSERRRDEIKRVFSAPTDVGIVPATSEAVIACSANWGR